MAQTAKSTNALPHILSKRKGTNEALWSKWPLTGCWINTRGYESGAAMILVARKASKGHIYAVFYVGYPGGLADIVGNYPLNDQELAHLRNNLFEQGFGTPTEPLEIGRAAKIVHEAVMRAKAHGEKLPSGYSSWLRLLPPAVVQPIQEPTKSEATPKSERTDMKEGSGYWDFEPPPGTPLQEAQDLAWVAWDEADINRAKRMARKALKISPDCADGYNILAYYEPSWKKAALLYEQAVVTGKRALGESYFRRFKGMFWGVLETRPYIRALVGLAQCRWALEQFEESVNLDMEVLRLNRSDNQGVRFFLVNKLMLLDRDEEAEKILRKYNGEGENEVVAWPAYNHALLLFRKHGPSAVATRTLRAALKVNHHVPEYLLGDKELPADRPSYYSHGSREEAILYAEEAFDSWSLTPGALGWLGGKMGA